MGLHHYEDLVCAKCKEYAGDGEQCEKCSAHVCKDCSGRFSDVVENVEDHMRELREAVIGDLRGSAVKAGESEEFKLDPDDLEYDSRARICEDCSTELFNRLTGIKPCDSYKEFVAKKAGYESDAAAREAFESFETSIAKEAGFESTREAHAAHHAYDRNNDLRHMRAKVQEDIDEVAKTLENKDPRRHPAVLWAYSEERKVTFAELAKEWVLMTPAAKKPWIKASKSKKRKSDKAEKPADEVAAKKPVVAKPKLKSKDEEKIQAQLQEFRAALQADEAQKKLSAASAAPAETKSAAAAAVEPLKQIKAAPAPKDFVAVRIPAKDIDKALNDPTLAARVQAAIAAAPSQVYGSFTGLDFTGDD